MLPPSTVAALVGASRTRWVRAVAGAGALAVAASYLFHPIAYRIDLEVYRAGGRAWLDGVDLYAQPFRPRSVTRSRSPTRRFPRSCSARWRGSR